MIGIEVPEATREAVVNELAAREVHVGPRSSWLRVSPHLHTTQADIDQLFAALDAAL